MSYDLGEGKRCRVRVKAAFDNLEVGGYAAQVLIGRFVCEIA